MQRNAGIVGTGFYVPEKVVTNKDVVEKCPSTNEEFIERMTGIRERREAADDEVVVDLAVKACRKALDNAGVAPEDVGLVVFCCTSPDYFCPANACLVQRDLGCVNAAAFDLDTVCSAANFGLAMGSKFVADGTCEYVLVVGAELFIRSADWGNRDTCIFFGDGSGAFVIGEVPTDYGLKGSWLKSDGRIHEALVTTTDAKILQMDGKAVYSFAVEAFPEAVRGACANAGVPVSDIDFVIAHQANIRIIEAAMQTLGLPMNKTHITLDRYGNTVSGSQFVTLAEAVQEGKIKKGDLVCLVGFGGGMSWGANIMRWH
ncbi:MAG: 3-oxoacyl-ACP synthase III family protein [Candidatus Nanoarchaeia archaeon]